MTQATNQLVNSTDNCIAALDIGSNSFHFVLARIIDDHLQILHSEKHQVQLANGLDQDNNLSQEAIERSLKTLETLANITQPLTADNFRIVATYTLRKAKNAHHFLRQAAEIFPFDIEVISGHEEARLIYQGVSHYVSSDEKRLIIDIGGGSTECVIGKNEQTFILDSLEMGCVSFAHSYFTEGKISKKSFEHAILHASLEIEAVSARFSKVGWKSVIGTSGTIKSIYQIINFDNELPQPINLKQLHQLRDELISYKHVDKISIKGLKENRRSIICSGLAILIALTEVLNIKEIDLCTYALREGVLFEQYQQKLTGDVHSRTVSSLLTRFNADTEQATRVTDLASDLFKQVKDSWSLGGKHYASLLTWATSLHEIGLNINASGFHKHGRYIIENADLAGFNQEQVQAIAWLVGNQRRKIQAVDEFSWYLFKPIKMLKTLVLLRLACLLSKQRQLTDFPEIKIKAKDNKVSLQFPDHWLIDYPMLCADLQQEQSLLTNIEMSLSFS